LRTVAALYVDPRGPYPRMPGVDCWDEARDARLYAGPHPVVAHPPCAHYGRLRHLATKDDADCAPLAVEQVRRFGGVLEHPRGSVLWELCGMALPGHLPDAHGGISLDVNQCDWEHVAQKGTWLYLVGVRPEAYPRMPRRAPTHVVTTSRRTRGRRLPEMKKTERHITPPLFAEFLVSLARAAWCNNVSPVEHAG